MDSRCSVGRRGVGGLPRLSGATSIFAATAAAKAVAWAEAARFEAAAVAMHRADTAATRLVAIARAVTGEAVGIGGGPEGLHRQRCGGSVVERPRTDRLAVTVATDRVGGLSDRGSIAPDSFGERHTRRAGDELAAGVPCGKDADETVESVAAHRSSSRGVGPVDATRMG